MVYDCFHSEVIKQYNTPQKYHKDTENIETYQKLVHCVLLELPVQWTIV